MRHSPGGMGPGFVVLLLVVGRLCQHARGELLDRFGLRQKTDDLVRTWFSPEPRCHPSTCPVPLSDYWKELNQDCCAPRGLTFHCQNIDEKRPLSFCMDAVPCPPGTFADLELIRMRKYPKEPLCQVCPSFEFQPTQTASYMFNNQQCHHRRRLCTDVNAVNVVFGKADADDVCRCPHYLNYQPVPLADNNCVIFNSSSECKCEHKPCPKGQTMTEKGYQCLDIALAKTLDSFHHEEPDNLLQEVNAGLEPRVCLGKDCPKPSPTDPNWLNSLQDLHLSYGLFVPVFLAIVAFFVYKGVRFASILLSKGPRRYDILVCITIPSSKICQFVFEEIQNSLPLLERLYGPLTLDHDVEFTYITVIVRPRLAKMDFSLLQFIRDLFGSVKIAKYLNGASEEVQIVAAHGSSTDVTKASFKEAALKHRNVLAFDTGEVTLRFSDKANEAKVLHELTSAKDDLKSLFGLYNLNFTNVHQGSIKLTFSFPAQPDTFDSLANEQRIKQIVSDLCSYDSFKQLTKGDDVTVEFLCKAKLNAVSVVQTQNLIVQVGNQNNVYISDHPPQALDADKENDDSVEFDEDEPEKREFLSYNIVSISRRNQAVLDGTGRMDHEEQNLIGEVDPESPAIHVFVKCDDSVAEELHIEWSNSMPLLIRLYPTCKLRRATGGMMWELHPLASSYQDVTNFVADLFLTHRLQDIKSRSDVQIDVPISALTSGPVWDSRLRQVDKAKNEKLNCENAKTIRFGLIVVLFALMAATFANNECSAFIAYILTP